MDEKQVDLSAKIEELTFWMKFSIWTTFVKMLTATLRLMTQKSLFMSFIIEGDKSTRDIAQIVSSNGRQITHQTVKNMWQRWSQYAIATSRRHAGTV